MCPFFSQGGRAQYRSLTRSVRLSGRATSVRLEVAFWEFLDAMSRERGQSTPQFLSELYDRLTEAEGDRVSFTSFLRTTCLLHSISNAANREI